MRDDLAPEAVSPRNVDELVDDGQGGDDDIESQHTAVVVDGTVLGSALTRGYSLFLVATYSISVVGADAEDNSRGDEPKLGERCPDGSRRDHDCLEWRLRLGSKVGVAMARTQSDY